METIGPIYTSQDWEICFNGLYLYCCFFCLFICSLISLDSTVAWDPFNVELIIRIWLDDTFHSLESFLVTSLGELYGWAKYCSIYLIFNSRPIYDECAVGCRFVLFHRFILISHYMHSCLDAFPGVPDVGVYFLQILEFWFMRFSMLDWKEKIPKIDHGRVRYLLRPTVCPQVAGPPSDPLLLADS